MLGASITTRRITLRTMTSGSAWTASACVRVAAACRAKPAAGAKKLSAAPIHAHVRMRALLERPVRVRRSVVIALVELVLFILGSVFGPFPIVRSVFGLVFVALFGLVHVVVIVIRVVVVCGVRVR